MRTRTAAATAAITLALVVVVVVAAGCSTASSDEGFTGHGWISATIGYPMVTDASAKNCDVATARGTIREGSRVTILVGNEVAGSATLGAGSFSSNTIGRCKWEFAADVDRIADSYTVRLPDGTEKAATVEQLREGTFQYGAIATQVN